MSWRFSLRGICFGAQAWVLPELSHCFRRKQKHRRWDLGFFDSLVGKVANRPNNHG
jgi:hypothetical protein